MLPSEYFGLPVIGRIKTRPLKFSSTKDDDSSPTEQEFPSEIYEVIQVNEHFYVANQWNDEDRLRPQLIPLMMVEDFVEV